MNKYWYRSSLSLFAIVLWPFSFLFGLIISLRYFLFRIGIFKVQRFSVPVVVVGNITIGGTGKTPFVIWLAHYLTSLGLKPGIVTRGAGGKNHYLPHLVSQNDPPNLVGDEALLLCRRTESPVVIGIKRSACAAYLRKNTACNIIISDDGLQHYYLGRDIEIALVDGERLLGNKLLLPAGPLREKPSRLKKVDFVIVKNCSSAQYYMTYQQSHFVSLINPNHKVLITKFLHKKIHAIAGIGHPHHFLEGLQQQGFEIIPHVFPDHYHYKPLDFNFPDMYPIVMTEKDAVKCQDFSCDRFWTMPITAVLNDEFKKKFLYQLKLLEVFHENKMDLVSNII